MCTMQAFSTFSLEKNPKPSCTFSSTSKSYYVYTHEWKGLDFQYASVLWISMVSDTICGIADCYNSVLHLAQIGAQFSHGTFPAGSERMQAETEDYLVEWRGCVAQLVNLISPVACFSEVFGILVLNRMLFSSPSLSFTFPVSKWFWFHHCLFNILLSQSSLPFVLSWRWPSTGSRWHFEWPASPRGSSWIVRAVVCSAPSGFCFGPCCA